MYSVLVELPGLRQLEKIEPGAESRIYERVLSYFEPGRAGEENLSRINGCAIYLQREEEENTQARFWAGIEGLYRYLLDNRQEFQGFLILVNKIKKIGLGDGYRQIRRESYPLRKTDALLVGPEAGEDFCRYLPGVRDEKYWILKPYKALDLPEIFEGENLFFRERLVEKLIPCLVPEVGKALKSRILWFYGRRGVGKFFNLCRGIRRIRREAPLILPVVQGTEGLKSSFQEIIESLDRDFILRAPSFLSVPEETSYRSRLFLFSSGASEQGKEDIYLFFRLYLIAYIRECEALNHQAFLLCRTPEYLDLEISGVLERIFRELMPLGLFPLVVSEARRPQDLWPGLPCLGVRINPLSLEEIGGIIKGAGLRGIGAQRLKEITRGSILRIFHYALLMQMREESGGDPEDVSRLFLKELPQPLQKCLYAVSLFPGFASQEMWSRILEDRGEIFQAPEPLLGELRRYGLLTPDLLLRPALPDISDQVSLEESAKERIRGNVIARISDLWKRYPDISIYTFLHGLKHILDNPDFIRQFFDYAAGLLEQGQIARAEALIEIFGNLSSGAPPGFARAVSDSLALRAALMKGDREMAGVRFSSLGDYPAAGDQGALPAVFSEALINLESSRYYYALGKYRKALDFAKKALLDFQEKNYPSLQADASRQIGLAMLGMGRLNEGAMYFTICRERLNFNDAPHSYIRALIMEGICQFIWGNYSRTGGLFSRARELSAALGRRDWEGFALFLLGRSNFELGRYGEAEALFVEGLLLSRLYFNDERMKVHRAWIARSLIYQGKPAAALGIFESFKPDAEALFFSAEAFFFLHDIPRALKVLDIVLDRRLNRVMDFYPGEYIYWRSGFCSVEDRAMGEGRDVLSSLIQVFRAYLMGTGDRDRGSQELAQFVREEGLSEADPYRHLYYYLYKLTVPEEGDKETLNRLTLLSRASKYLQLRAARIEDSRDRKDFLTKNYWNSLLTGESQ
ncbi:MAG: hypothetical protein LBQ61_08100, partial [Spirochaetales bacterium]|nr:hypothetical protein [Spirochaetales bacterium]